MMHLPRQSRRGVPIFLLAVSLLVGLLSTSASAIDLRPESSSQCAASHFCVWSGSLYTGTVFSTVASGNVLGMTVAGSVWNRTSAAVRVYAATGGEWVVDVYRPGGSSGQHEHGSTLGEGSGHDHLLASEAFTGLYAASYRDVRAFIVRRVGFDGADDVVADVFATVWARWESAPPDLDQQRAWTFGVAHHKLQESSHASMRLRRLQDRLTRTPLRPHRDPGDDMAALERAREILALLPGAERDAVSLTVLAGLPCDQAAQILGCSTSAVTSRVHRARLRLRDLLEDRRGQA